LRITGVVEILDNTTSGEPGKAVIVRPNHAMVLAGGDATNNGLKIIAHDGSFTRFQHRVNSYHAARFVVATNSATATFEFAQTGNAIASGAWVNSGSDERIKECITPIENWRDILMNIRAATWKYRHTGASGRFGIDSIANDIGKFLPYAVINTGARELEDGSIVDDVLAVEAGDSGSMVAMHHAALQSLVEENRSQNDEIETLRIKIEELRKRVEGFIVK